MRTGLFTVRMAVCLICVSMLAGCGGEPPPAVAVPAVQAPAIPAPPAEAQPMLPGRGDPKEKVEAQIAEHKQLLDSNPEDPDTAARLMAVGNLYRQKLMDYEQAAVYYRRVITEFPDSPQITLAFIQLGTCYEKLDDWRAANLLYREMTDKFPEDSQEHQYAVMKQNEL